MSYSLYNSEFSNNYHIFWYPPPSRHHYDQEQNQVLVLVFFVFGKFSIFGFFCLTQLFVLDKNCLRQKSRRRQKNCLIWPISIQWTFGLCRVIFDFDFIELLEIAQWNSFLWHIHHFRRELRSNVIR